MKADRRSGWLMVEQWLRLIMSFQALNGPAGHDPGVATATAASAHHRLHLRTIGGIRAFPRKDVAGGAG